MSLPTSEVDQRQCLSDSSDDFNACPTNMSSATVLTSQLSNRENCVCSDRAIMTLLASWKTATEKISVTTTTIIIIVIITLLHCSDNYDNESEIKR